MVNWITKYRKILMICLVVIIALIVLPIITYTTEYNKTKVDPKTVFSITDSDAVFVSEKDFKNQFDFNVYCSEYNPATKEDDKVTNGSYKWTITATKKKTSTVSSLTCSLALAANWANYDGNDNYSTKLSSGNSVTLNGKEKTCSMTSVSTVYPVHGRLWFTKVSSPTLYVYVKWTGEDSKTYYTTFDLKKSEYITDKTVML